MRLVLDSSVLIAAIRPTEAEHADARAFVDQLRSVQPSSEVSLFGPPELWLELRADEYQ